MDTDEYKPSERYMKIFRMIVSGSTYQEVGAGENITRERVRQIFARTFKRLNLGEALFDGRDYGISRGTVRLHEIRAKAQEIFRLIGWNYEH